MPAGRLDVTVLNAVRLKDTQTFGRQDPYCLLRCGTTQHKTKTCADGGTMPRFNEAFSFNLTGSETEVVISIHNQNVMTKHDHIGTAKVQLAGVFGSGREDQRCQVIDPKGKSGGELSVSLVFAAAYPSYTAPGPPPTYGMPVHQASAPMGYGQAPAGYGQAPAGYGQAPAGYGQPPVGWYGQAQPYPQPTQYPPMQYPHPNPPPAYGYYGQPPPPGQPKDGWFD